MPVLEKALKRQPRIARFLCHIFQRLSDERLNLVTGAGISVEAGVPAWHPLLDRLAERSNELKVDLQKHRDSGLDPEYLAQILYHRHRNDWGKSVADDLIEANLSYDWAESIHAAIYRDVPDEIKEVLKTHHYLAQLRDLARKIPMVINFNFDDLLSEAIGYQISHEDDGQERPYTVVWQPPVVDRTKTTTIYHVNGILPRVSLKRRSPKLIFTEDSFSDALARAPDVSGDFLFMRFVQNTMLIIGHSLGDSSLKSYLRRNREKSPANHHYMIHWLSTPNKIPLARRNDIFQANLELYNLITIFLTSEEIGEFLGLLNQGVRAVRDFLDGADPDRRSRFHYYIVGPVAAGKSTLLEHLRCFNTFEEWTRPPPNEMNLSIDKLTKKEQVKVDNFVYAELKEKNIRMDQAGVGFHFMDRAPLDLYAFSIDETERKKKTADLQNIVTRDKALQAGQIVFLTASGNTLVKRNLGRGRIPEKSGSEIYFEKQSNFLESIYEPNFVFKNTDLDAGSIAKQVARHALLNEFDPCDLTAIMERFK